MYREADGLRCDLLPIGGGGASGGADLDVDVDVDMDDGGVVVKEVSRD